MRRIAASFLVPLLLAGVVPSAQAATADALALTEAAAMLEPNHFIWNDDPAATGPVSVLVSIPDQRAYIFRGRQLVAASSVSTGSDEKPTPTGLFTILQKNARHRSNLYDSAPMPYMQRLTWDGVALHAGANPGFPASHGCIRLPTAFAKKLFAATRLGATVEVTDQAYVADTYLPAGEYASR